MITSSVTRAFLFAIIMYLFVVIFVCLFVVLFCVVLVSSPLLVSRGLVSSLSAVAVAFVRLFVVLF